VKVKSPHAFSISENNKSSATAAQLGEKAAAAFVAIHGLPAEISSKELSAYETELIRSRNPEHNRSGRLAA